MLDKYILLKIKKYFNKRADIDFAFIFGSNAYGNTIKKSDIDIAIFINKKNSKNLFKKKINIINDLSTLLKKDIDLIILNNIKSLLFKYSIIKEGSLIYDKNTFSRIMFEFKTITDFLNHKSFLDVYDNNYVKMNK